MISRAAEAGRIASFITTNKAHFMVLCGPEASGKSVLVTRWLIPALRTTTKPDGYQVYYGHCAGALPDSMSGENGETPLSDLLTQKTISLIDEFDWVLDLPRDERRIQVEALFAMVARANPDAIVVVIISQRHLTSMYALSSYQPGIVNAVCDIKPVGLADGLEQLSHEDSDAKISYSAELLQTLTEESQDFAKRGMDVSFDLLKLLHARFARVSRETGVKRIDVQRYTAVGGLLGVLREHVDSHLDALEAAQPGSDKLARAILERVLEAQARGAAPDFEEMAPRFDVSSDEVYDVVDQLAVPGGLLHSTTLGQYDFQPPQIVIILREDAALRQLQRERALRIIEEGLRSRQQIGTFLPAARFAEIHRQRRYLVLDDEAIRFLAQCALRDDGADSGAAEYWLARVTSRDDAMDILLATAFDTSAEVRGRAAALLGEFAEPLVRERLAVLALTDPTPAVRALAIESLSHMADDALLAQLLEEVRNPTGARRREAIETLRVFPRADVAAVLQGLVKEPGTDLALREAAVSVLAALNIGEAVDGLVDIALHDPDAEDRDAAARALTRTEPEDLNRRILSRLDWRRPTGRVIVVGLLLTIALTLGTAIAASSALLFEGLLPGTLVIFALLVPASVGGVLLVRLRDGRLRWRSPIGVIAVLLFAFCAITVMPVVHGLAHLMIKQRRRALTLFGLELLGVFMFYVLAGATEFVPGVRIIAVLYRALGIALFVGSYLFDVLAVALDTIVFRQAMTREAQRAAIYREVFRNPSMVAAVFGDLRSSIPVEVRRAKRLIHRFAQRMLPAKLVDLLIAGDPVYQPYVVHVLRRSKDEETIRKLESLWAGADAPQQAAIAAVLSGHPTSRSVEALERVGARTGAVVRSRAGLARLRFRLSVWPWSTRLAALCFVPALGILLYHGAMIRRNPAWAAIITLRQPLPSATQKVKIVDFLVDAYAKESVDQLRDLFLEKRSSHSDSLNTALVRGMVTLENVGLIEPNDPLRAQLKNELVRYSALLSDPDSITCLAGFDVLKTMVDASDSTLANAAVASLVRFVNTDTATPGMTWRKQAAIHAVGSMQYTRALPALDSLLKQRIANKVQSKDRAAAAVTDMIRDQILQVAKQAYAAVPERNASQERTKLLATLVDLSFTIPELRALKGQVENANRVSNGCDRNADGACDGKDDALKAIAESPASEDGYRDLVSHYTTTNQYQQATDVFTRLIQEHPASIWPRLILAEIYHGDRSAEDASFFERSYDAIVALRKLPVYAQMKTSAPEDYARVEADFVEIALTAKHYAEAETAARDLLAEPSGFYVDRLNMALFIYIASVMRHDPSVAVPRLAELETVVRSLPPDYYNNWIYPGTLVFIDHSDLSPPLKAALRKLCRGGRWYSTQQAATIIAENRTALQSIGARAAY
ncbi:MAG: HEAT repeat domain-containing protein [bacterium]